MWGHSGYRKTVSLLVCTKLLSIPLDERGDETTETRELYTSVRVEEKRGEVLVKPN